MKKYKSIVKTLSIGYCSRLGYCSRQSNWITKPRTFKIIKNKCVLNLICDLSICEVLHIIYGVRLNPVSVVMILSLLSD